MCMQDLWIRNNSQVTSKLVEFQPGVSELVEYNDKRIFLFFQVSFGVGTLSSFGPRMKEDPGADVWNPVNPQNMWMFQQPFPPVECDWFISITDAPLTMFICERVLNRSADELLKEYYQKYGNR